MTKEQLIEEMVTEVMEDFDFDRVHHVMVSLNWRWSVENGKEIVPSTYRLMKTAEKLLREVAEHYGDDGTHTHATGGLMAILDGDSLTLQFILAEATSYDSDYK